MTDLCTDEMLPDAPYVGLVYHYHIGKLQFRNLVAALTYDGIVVLSYTDNELLDPEDEPILYDWAEINEGTSTEFLHMERST